MTDLMSSLALAKRTDGYWILDPTGEILDGPCGPYDRKAEAEADRRGLERYAKFGERPGYVTSDPRRQTLTPASRQGA